MLLVSQSNGTAKEWHVGESRPNISAHSVVELYADGHELEWILERFTGLPVFVGGRGTRWFGDTAKTVFSALPNAVSR